MAKRFYPTQDKPLTAVRAMALLRRLDTYRGSLSRELRDEKAELYDIAGALEEHVRWALAASSRRSKA